MRSQQIQARNSPAGVKFPDYGIFAIESHHGKDFVMEVMEHDYIKILYIIGGSGGIKLGEQAYELKKESIVYIPTNTSHRIIDKKNPMSLFALCIDPHSLPIAISAKLPDLSFIVSDTGRHSLIWHDRFKQLLYEQTMKLDDHDIAIHQITLWILQQMRISMRDYSRAAESAVDRVKLVYEDMKHNFYLKASLADAANEAGLSERRFSQIFREIASDSWLNYLRSLRVKHASYLLRETERSVTSIAFESGFSDLSNFYRAFSKIEGCHPLMLREKQRRSPSR